MRTLTHSKMKLPSEIYLEGREQLKGAKWHEIQRAERALIERAEKAEKQRDEMRQLLAIEEEKSESRALLIKALKEQSQQTILVREDKWPDTW